MYGSQEIHRHFSFGLKENQIVAERSVRIWRFKVIWVGFIRSDYACISNKTNVKNISAENPRGSVLFYVARVKTVPYWSTERLNEMGKKESKDKKIYFKRYNHFFIFLEKLFYKINRTLNRLRWIGMIVLRRLRELILRNSAKWSRSFGRRDTSFVREHQIGSENCLLKTQDFAKSQDEV